MWVIGYQLIMRFNYTGIMDPMKKVVRIPEVVKVEVDSRHQKEDMIDPLNVQIGIWMEIYVLLTQDLHVIF